MNPAPKPSASTVPYTLPLLVRPDPGQLEASSAVVEAEAPGRATAWISERRQALGEQLVEHGALLFRGFGLREALGFEQAALAFEPGLQEVYRGTAPRSSRTRYVYNSTELPAVFPIPQHCEMSFLPEAPRRLFFFCRIAPERNGETPLVDCRRVYESMDPAVREPFERRGIRHVRNYNRPGKRLTIDLTKLKTWDRVFQTEDPEAVSLKCEEEKQVYEWLPGSSLRLTNSGPAMRTQPETGRKSWFNHSQVFHACGPVIEARNVARRQGDLRTRLFHWFLEVVYLLNRPGDPMKRGTHVTYGDGGEIPISHIRHVQELLWTHMVFHRWQAGDLVAIDNFAVSHGRMPFRGPREILVAWSA